MKSFNLILKAMFLTVTLAVLVGCSQGSFQTESLTSSNEDDAIVNKMTAKRPPKFNTTTTTLPQSTTTTTLPVSSDGYTHCAYEGQFCSFSGTMSVRYGANGVYAYKTLTGGTNCSNDIFGDPVPGVVKTCAIKATTTTTTMAPTTTTMPALQQPDLVVTSLTMSPAQPKAGEAVRFSATILNQGTKATPSGIEHGVLFYIDDQPVTWSTGNFNSLAPGQSLTVSATGGPIGDSATWSATAGSHTLKALADDINRIVESNENNNHLGISFSVATVTVTTTTTSTTTTTLAPPATVPAGYKLWSDPVTWGGAVPAAGQDVTIPAGTNVLLDVNTASLGILSIEGALVFANKDLALTAATIYVDGTLQIGSASAPFINKATITLTGSSAAGSFSRGIMAHGKLLLYGVAPNKAWTQLGDHANAGATSLKLKESVNWKVGDRIVIAPTEFWPGTSDATRVQEEVAQLPTFTEEKVVSSASGDTLSLSSSLANFHWGLLQYVTNSGMSLVPDFAFVPPSEPFNRVLDERAEVGNLTRNIVIQSIDDEAWRTSGFGANVMMMTLGSLAQLDGVEFRRVGQAGKLGRYPFHWHMLSYDSASGTYLGEATGHYVKNSTISQSMNRCLVIHGTNGVLVQNNICFDIKGHAFFLEDAVERRNTLEGNLALRIRRPAADKMLLVHEGQTGFSYGSSGFWMTNPDNITRNNHVADAYGPGFWFAFPNKPLGLSKLVPISPDNMHHRITEFNTSHSNGGPGLLFDAVPVDDFGNLALNKYTPTVLENENTWDNRVRFEMKRITSYKNMGGGYRNRVSFPDYVEWTVADNVGTALVGQVDKGDFIRGLVVGTSLNNVKPYPINIWPYDPPAAFASYHSTLHFIDNVVVNFPLVVGKRSGTFLTDDYYTDAVDKGTVRNPGNRLISADSGYRFLPVEYRVTNPNNEHWTLAGALWDPHGYWGPKGNFWVYDMPFFTYGANCQSVAPAGQNGMSCAGEYFGVQGFNTDFDFSNSLFKSPIDVVRQTSSGQVIGTWKVGDGLVGSPMLNNMRHFAARPGGEYILRFPDRPLPRLFIGQVTNAYRAGDSILLAVGYGGRDIPEAYITTSNAWGQYVQPPGSIYRAEIVRASSLSEVHSSTTPKYFVDRANALIWVKYTGGLPVPNYDPDPNSDNKLYGHHNLVINGQ